MAFRSELSQMSLEEILSLKQKVGIKAYNRVGSIIFEFHLIV